MNSQVHRCNTGVIPHLAFEKMPFSGQERCVAVMCCCLETSQGNLSVQVLLCDEAADEMIQYK